jgi:hypothetical protein
MSIYATKAVFFAEGMTPYPIPHGKPDCPICMEELDSEENNTVLAVTTVFTVDTNNSRAEPIEDHLPIKVPCCGNILGRHCLKVWLKTGNSCPFCRAEFFPKCVARHRLVTMVETAVGTAAETAIRRAIDEYLDELRGDEASDEYPDRSGSGSNEARYGSGEDEDSSEDDSDSHLESLYSNSGSHDSEGLDEPGINNEESSSGVRTPELIAIVAGTLVEDLAENLAETFGEILTETLRALR